ncbi:enoyl-CoA hydratase/isomerase family protein [Novosphingobium sp. HII-3]|uniref:enoyl-CoA hydratase/isomerase family protein n=1 Tax=Novosphingobium sp. HII-3 TaxID=2075565 RepID=UPI001E64C79B|nr:enoyl-CoA hydratase/isomerase family protein [Novosphingobium sp. HII-3]
MGQASEGQVQVERRDTVAIVRFANPPHGFVANKGAAQLCEAVGQLIEDNGIRAIVLTGGQEGVFIRHADVGQIARAADALAGGRIAPSSFVTTPFMELGAMLEAAHKPVIAAIDGVCMGGGFELALACTVRIASPMARSIGLPEIRIDIIPGAGGIKRLSDAIGMHRARLFALRGAVVSAEEALDLGLVDEIAPSALDRAVALAEEFAGRAVTAVRVIMRLAREQSGLEGVGMAMGELLRDDQSARARLHRFTEQGEWLETLS